MVNFEKFDSGSLRRYLWCSLDSLNLKEEDKKTTYEFWCNFFEKLDEDAYHVDHVSIRHEYKDEVIMLLERGRFTRKIEDLYKLQLEIEDITTKFDEESLYSTEQNLVKKLIGEEAGESAKDYIRERVKGDISEVDELLAEFGHYNIEGLIVKVLSQVFFPSKVGNESLVRLAALVEQLEESVRMHAFLLRSRRKNKKENNSNNNEKKHKSLDDKEEFFGKYQCEGGKKGSLYKMYPFGIALAEFLEKRGLISFTTHLKESVRVRNKDTYYLPKTVFVITNFDQSLLPMKLNLPMICPPVPWSVKRGSSSTTDTDRITFSDLIGGYLTAPTGEIYDRYRLLSSKDTSHFYIELKEAQKVCDVMNKLQSQPFKINSFWLENLQEAESYFIEKGLLVPKLLASINLSKVSPILRAHHMENEKINKLFSYEDLLRYLCKRMQRANYEKLILKLAAAFEDYNFYLPAFADFRGRIYRCGTLHYHECDLARSLVLFSNPNPNLSWEIYRSPEFINRFLCQTAFHYKSYPRPMDGAVWIKGAFQELKVKGECINTNFLDKFVDLAKEAKHPFQFLCNIFLLTYYYIQGHSPRGACLFTEIPITQDASASAYQIMSYFLMDEGLARKTNLLPSDFDEIEDIYSHFLEEFKGYLVKECKAGALEKSLVKSVSALLNRKIIKSFFMPVVYGKRVKSYTDDLFEAYSHYLTRADCGTIAKACFRFWEIQYSGMKSLIDLVRCIAQVVSWADNPVVYGVSDYITVQDYTKMKMVKLSVYDKNRKQHRISLRIPTSQRDPAKTKIATFANFIHQKDAHIAMSVVNKMEGPIYTVHDNFITNVLHSSSVAMCYSKAFQDIGYPLEAINIYIYMNVIEPMERAPFRNNPFELIHGKISSEMLRKYLEDLISLNKCTSAKTKNSRLETIETIISCYERYTNTVCGKNDNDPYSGHTRKCNKFVAKLLSEYMSESSVLRYCVHY